ncbi:MAG TPA: LamG domain-containing protein [Planctomycetota bacterium]|nr:LamG domain-containing protein [Planctomycetota bacterium]
MKRAFLILFFAAFAAFTGFAAEPVLVGHWKLDEKDGDVVADSSASKNNAKAMNAPARVPGKVGGAFSFDGKNQYVEIPNSKELEKLQLGSYAIAAWFKAENVPLGTTDEANDAQYGIVLRTGWHEGVTYTKDKKFLFTHWIMGEKDPVWTGIGAWDTDYEPGEWHHLVGVVDKDARVAKIYVDGELKGTTEPWDAKAVAKDYAQITWKIGIGNPGSDKYAWPAKGAIDDVRLYASALSDEQVKAIYDAGAAGKEK